jgi:hypothetical protein
MKSVSYGVCVLQGISKGFLAKECKAIGNSFQTTILMVDIGGSTGNGIGEANERG